MRHALPQCDRMRADEIAPSAALRFSCDEDAGWRRLRRGRGFAYADAAGNRPGLGDLARIKALAIPPAWRAVWICRDPRGHIQATGRDERGRKQYRYHADWTARRSATKFHMLADFAAALPALRAQVDADLRRHRLGFPRVVASIVWLLDNSLIRVGNPAYARDNRSFGLTTLRQRHLEITGETLRFRFRGKSGKQWNLGLADRRIARVLRALQDLPGQHLFQYEDEGARHAITSREVNDYIAAHAGPDFTSKHFRTWAGSVRAFGLLADLPLPESAAGRARALNGAIDAVAAKLGNTRAVCRQGYIHPAILADWQAGALHRSGRLRPVEGLDGDEVETVHFLKRHASTTRADPKAGP